MSLLMEALKKAEQAKRKVAEGVVPAASAPLALEPTSAEAHAVSPESKSTSETPPRSPAPVLTAAAFTSMTGRLVDQHPAASTPAPVSPPSMQIEAAPRAAPVREPHAPMPAAPGKAELSLDKSARAEPQPASAARRLPARRRIPTVWIGGGVALLFTLIGGGTWYYNSMAHYLTQQATLGVPENALAQTVPAPVTPTPVLVTPKVAEPPYPVQRNPAKIQLTNKPTSVPVVASPSSTKVPAPVIAVPQDAAALENATADSVPVPPPAPVAVSRDEEQNDTFTTLQTAYRAYQSGDDSAAQKLYARVLGHDGHNRDALLGVAAIAVRQKDFVRAQEIYSELLTLDPKDSVAQAGFVSVTSSFDPLQQEARIKTLLEQEPGASHLLFTYASFLMQQQRWLEATRTLQPALQAQRDNADYAFNLAVSFDHLGQNDAAVKYYRTALELAAKQSSSFRPDDVRRRLQAMSANGSGSP
ncbi:MAG: tetratricopeptide repeat protein [Gammaproteobacteria bacterium]|nr:tetratricopeptide repeat protein [Gammaproteobacteria bacterium]